MNKKEKTYQVKFDKYTYGGEVMGRLPDGRAVFTPYVLSGEEARVRPVFEKKNFVKAEKLSIISSSKDRVSPPCPHYEDCGGCHYQHLPYDKQLAVKEQILIDQLERIGGIENPPVRPIFGCDEQFNYRNTVQFHVGDGGETGFLSAFGQELVPLSNCLLPQQPILNLWKQLELEAYPGLRQVHFRCGLDDDLMVIFESDLHDELPEMALDMPISAVHLSPAGSIVMAGDDHLIMEVKGKYFKVSAESFFQVNTVQAKKMVDQVLAYMPETGERLIELYSGVGLFTAFLAPRFKEVIAVESSESACNDFAANLDEFDHIGLYIGKAEQIIKGIEGPADVILVDPPRSGLQPEVVDVIVEKNPERLVYVSCDTATFARDAKRLIGQGYELVEVTPIDMFPQTYHIEQIGLFKRK